MSAPELHGTRVLITGASGGLGPTLVQAFLALGASVIGVGRRRTALDDLRASLGHPERLEVAECDVSNPAGVESLFDAVERKRPVGAVVHAVGAFVYSMLESSKDEEIHRLVQGNLVSTIFVLRAAVQRMAARGQGSIVVIGSDRAMNPEKGFGLYGATKAAVLYLVQTTASEVQRKGVRVNAILPGTIDTPANRAAMPDTDASHWVKTIDIAKAVVWLTGSESSGINGALLRMPGD